MLLYHETDGANAEGIARLETLVHRQACRTAEPVRVGAVFGHGESRT